MAVTRRAYVFGAFVSGVLCVLLVVIALASDSWVTSTAVAPNQAAASFIRYGLFRGEFTNREMVTPSIHTLYMTCVWDFRVCAVSCKTNAQARELEVRALAAGHQPNAACGSSTTVETGNRFQVPPVISLPFYACFITLLVVHLVLSLAAAGLAILNATTNPTLPAFGLPGCLWMNVATALVGVGVMVMFATYWLTSGLRNHLAMTHIAAGLFSASSGLGYSYWLVLVACLCSITNVALIIIRAYLLERDPPPGKPIDETVHSDGTIFLY